MPQKLENAKNALCKTMRHPNMVKVFSERNLYWFLFIVVWTYIWLRAAFTQLTHDETATFFRFIQLGKFLPYSLEDSATNHILNSFFSYIFYSLFGTQPLALRLANILSFPVFLYFLIKLAGLLQQRYQRILFVVVLISLHNFVEFFAMSRGYGLSMALLAAALWHLIHSLRQAQTKDYFLSLLFVSLALTANLTLLNTAIIFVFLLILKLFTVESPSLKNTWKNWFFILILGIVPLIFYSNYLFKLKDLGDLYYGLNSGFWEVSVRTLINAMLDPDLFIFEVFIAAYFVFILFFGLYFIKINFGIQKLFDSHLLFLYLLCGNIAAVILLRYLFNVNYPEDRTGLYFLVYFFGSLFFISDLFVKRFRIKYFYLLFVPLLFVPLHFVYSINLSHNSFDNHKIPSRFYDEVFEDYKPGEAPPTIGGYISREVRWAFLNFERGGKLGKVNSSLYPSTIEDFQIVDSTFSFPWRKIYDSVDYCKTSGLYLLKRKNPTPQKLMMEKTGVTTTGKITDEYFSLLTTEDTSLGNEKIEIVFDLHFNTDSTPFKSWLVATVTNRQYEGIHYEYFPLDWLKYNWDDENGHVINSMIVSFPEEAAMLNFYIWNVQKVPFEISDGSVQLLKYNLEK